MVRLRRCSGERPNPLLMCTVARQSGYRAIVLHTCNFVKMHPYETAVRSRDKSAQVAHGRGCVLRDLDQPYTTGRYMYNVKIVKQKKQPTYFLSVTSSNINGFQCFFTASYRNERHIWQCVFHSPYPINDATLPCKNQNTENAREQKFTICPLASNVDYKISIKCVKLHW